MRSRSYLAQRWKWGAHSQWHTEMCSGSEAGSYSRRIDFVYHSTLGLRVIKKKKSVAASPSPSEKVGSVDTGLGGSGAVGSGSEAGSYLRLIDFVYHSTLGLRVIKKNRRCRDLSLSSDLRCWRGVATST